MHQFGSGASPCQGADLVTAAAALSASIAQGKTAEELAMLASFFDIMRSNLTLMALNSVSEHDLISNQGTGTNTKQGRC